MIAAAVSAVVGFAGGWVIDQYTSHPMPGKERVDDAGFF
jgi:hypothetical protein